MYKGTAQCDTQVDSLLVFSAICHAYHLTLVEGQHLYSEGKGRCMGTVFSGLAHLDDLQHSKGPEHKFFFHLFKRLLL